MNPKLVIRADGGAQIGFGHVMRCLALGQAWQKAGGSVAFVGAASSPGLEARIGSAGMEFARIDAPPGSGADSEATIQIAKEMAAGWVAIDGYHFGAEHQRALKDGGLRVLAFDDYGHAGHYFADFVLNQNISADPKLYPLRDPKTRLLLGSRYVQLRSEFLGWREWERKISDEATRVLVTMGGEDRDNVAGKVLAALELLEELKLESRVVVGGACPHWAELQGRASGRAVELIRDPSGMAELMAWADVAISAAGSATWELAFMGVPSLLVSLADNQRAVAETMGRQGIAENLGWHEDVAAGAIGDALRELAGCRERRSRMSARGRALIDGHGSERVVAAMLERG